MAGESTCTVSAYVVPRAVVVEDVVVVGSKRSATRVVMNSMDLRHAPQRRGHRLRAVLLVGGEDGRLGRWVVERGGKNTETAKSVRRRDRH